MQVYQVLSKLTKKYQYETDQHRHWQGTVMIQSFHVGTKQQQPWQLQPWTVPPQGDAIPWSQGLGWKPSVGPLVGFIHNVGNRCLLTKRKQFQVM